MTIKIEKGIKMPGRQLSLLRKDMAALKVGDSFCFKGIPRATVYAASYALKMKVATRGERCWRVK